MIVFRECQYNQLIIRSLCLVVSSSLCISLPFNINNYCSSCLQPPPDFGSSFQLHFFISLQFNRLLLLSPLAFSSSHGHWLCDCVCVCLISPRGASSLLLSLLFDAFSSPASAVCLCGKISQALEEQQQECKLSQIGHWESGQRQQRLDYAQRRWIHSH